MFHRNRRIAKPAPAKKIVEDRRLVVEITAPGEDVIIKTVDIAHPHYVAQLQRGEIRLFDAATDDRGPAVPFVATFGGRNETWHPKTEGVYIVRWKANRTEELKRWSLGMGDCTGPQHTRAAIARVYADIIAKHPDWVPHLEINKVPCVLCGDAPGMPGSSRVVIDPATLPAPVDGNRLCRWYA